jgi:hypothetical protein
VIGEAADPDWTNTHVARKHWCAESTPKVRRKYAAAAADATED